MDRIVVETTLENALENNALDSSHAIHCDALIDTGIARFRPILTEALFMDRQPEDGACKPLQCSVNAHAHLD
ncbi:MAG: hypothetical protein KDI50_09115 [Candidatus Competibacteraceae bacterium]|nr:hypothetical protein [Candidatus Competibacteraceae bacterium]